MFVKYWYLTVSPPFLDQILFLGLVFKFKTSPKPPSGCSSNLVQSFLRKRSLKFVQSFDKNWYLTVWRPFLGQNLFFWLVFKLKSYFYPKPPSRFSSNLVQSFLWRTSLKFVQICEKKIYLTVWRPFLGRNFNFFGSFSNLKFLRNRHQDLV